MNAGARTSLIFRAQSQSQQCGEMLVAGMVDLEGCGGNGIAKQGEFVQHIERLSKQVGNAEFIVPARDF